jgi:hypothetical protein
MDSVEIDGLVKLIALVSYFFGILLFWTLSFFINYHLVRFGIGTKPKRMSFIFFMGSIILTIVCTFYLIVILFV